MFYLTDYYFFVNFLVQSSEQTNIRLWRLLMKDPPGNFFIKKRVQSNSMTDLKKPSNKYYKMNKTTLADRFRQLTSRSEVSMGNLLFAITMASLISGQEPVQIIENRFFNIIATVKKNNL